MKKLKRNKEAIIKNEKETERGITLIALAVTIVALIILASVSIGALTGEDSIIKNAITGKEKTEIANEKEVVEVSTVQSIEKDRYGNITKIQLQNTLDNNTGKGVTSVTEDEDFIVTFLEPQRVYNVDQDGNVEYLGKQSELINQATISANPTSNTIPQLVQEVELKIKTPLSMEVEGLNLIYAWNQSESEEPAKEKFVKATLTGETRTKTAKVISSDTEAGNYYLWAKLTVGTGEITSCFGPYTIKDHTTLVVCDTEKESTSGYLGNTNIARNQIEKVTIATSFGSHSLEDENCWDVSQSQNGKYIAWYEDTDGDEFYEVTIAGEGGVVANSNSSRLFQYIGYNGDDTQVIYGIENFDTGLTQKMVSLFSQCRNMKNIELKKLNTSNVTDMSYMFSGCSSLESLDLRTFKTDKVTNLTGTFQDCTSLKTLDVSNWNTENVTGMGATQIGLQYGGTFQNCSSLTTLDIGKWKISKVWTIARMFQGCSSLKNLDVSEWDTSNIEGSWMVFDGCKSLTILDVSNWNTNKFGILREIFRNCKSLTTLDVSKWNTSKANNMSSMFQGCSSLTDLDVSKFDTKNVTTMSCMFDSCSNLKKIDVSKWDVSNLTEAGWMFCGCSKVAVLDTSNWKTTWNGGSIFYVFSGCSSLKRLDLSGITATNHTWIQGLFERCSSLEYLNIENFDTSAVTKMTWPFSGCTNLKELKINKFSMESVTDYSAVFDGVPSTVSITTNSTMAEWLNTNYPSLTNITLVN